MEPKTEVRVLLVGEDGNAFYIIGAVRKALKQNGYDKLAEEFWHEAKKGDYDHLLQTAIKYVHVE